MRVLGLTGDIRVLSHIVLVLILSAPELGPVLPWYEPHPDCAIGCEKTLLHPRLDANGGLDFGVLPWRLKGLRINGTPEEPYRMTTG